MSDQTLHYTLEIQWSDDDGCYVVVLPEFADRHAMPVADGGTYEDAAARGRNALENIVEFYRETGRPLPAPRTFAIATA